MAGPSFTSLTACCTVRPGASLSAPGPRPDRSGPPQATPFVFIGFNALIAPVAVLKQTSPEDVPLVGMSDPDPPVIVAVNFSAVPVHFEVVTVVRDGALMVVVAPLVHVIVPPVASVVATRATELPPVFPPEHPPTTMVPLSVPVIVEHANFTFTGFGGFVADAVPAKPTIAAPDTGMVSAAININVRRILCSLRSL